MIELTISRTSRSTLYLNWRKRTLTWDKNQAEQSSTGEWMYVSVYANSLQLCLTLCDPVDCSPPCSSVHGILQARILEWVGMPSSRGSSPSTDQTRVSFCLVHQQAGSLPIAPHRKPWVNIQCTKSYRTEVKAHLVCARVCATGIFL